jgi:hypothetical protein
MIIGIQNKFDGSDESDSMYEGTAKRSHERVFGSKQL